MPTVFVTNRGGHDYSEAERFGVIKFISDGLLDKRQISHMYRLVHEAMKDSQPDDFILLTSLTSLCSVASSYFVHRHGKLNLLVWHQGSYHERHLVFQQHNEVTTDEQVPDTAGGS